VGTPSSGQPLLEALTEMSNRYSAWAVGKVVVPAVADGLYVTARNAIPSRRGGSVEEGPDDEGPAVPMSEIDNPDLTIGTVDIDLSAAAGYYAEDDCGDAPPSLDHFEACNDWSRLAVGEVNGAMANADLLARIFATAASIRHALDNAENGDEGRFRGIGKVWYSPSASAYNSPLGNGPFTSCSTCPDGALVLPKADIPRGPMMGQRPELRLSVAVFEVQQDIELMNEVGRLFAYQCLDVFFRRAWHRSYITIFLYFAQIIHYQD
jgi:hypothetical protein